MSIAIYKNPTELKAKIKAMLGNVSKLKLSVHECLVNAELHNRNCGDVGPLNRIFVGTREVNNGNSVAKFILKECGVVWNNETNSFDHAAKKVTKMKADDNFEAANAALLKSTPYFELVKPQANPFKLSIPQRIAILKREGEAVAAGVHPSKKDTNGDPLKLTQEEIDACDLTGLEKVRQIAA